MPSVEATSSSPAAAAGFPRRCEPCGTGLIKSPSNWNDHVNSKQHIKKTCASIATTASTAALPATVPPQFPRRCEPCGTGLINNPSNWNNHANSKKHKKQLEAASSTTTAAIPAASRPPPTHTSKASVSAAAAAAPDAKRADEAVPAHLHQLMKKEEIATLPLGKYEGPILLYSNPKDAEDAAKKLLREPVLGFDTETKPRFKKDDPVLPPSLLQLAAKNAVHVFQLHLCGLTPSMIKVLSSKTIVKAGVNIVEDFRGLQRIAGFDAHGLAELADVAKELGTGTGLRQLAAVLFGLRISKKQATSNWANPTLTPAQLQYAATDAWLGYRIHAEFTSYGLTAPLRSVEMDSQQ